MRRGVFQLELFDEPLAEVTDSQDGVRYVLRRNPLRAGELAQTRREKEQTLEQLVLDQNKYLAEHSRARVATAVTDRRLVGRVEQKLEKLRLSKWLGVSAEGRTLRLVRDEDARRAASQLDGCYCLKTDLDESAASKDLVHQRYKSLSQVEWAFRTSKTTHLEVRPIYVRKASRTRAHVFVVMPAA